MNLNGTLEQISAQIKVDAKSLIDFASEDTIGGFHILPEKRNFPIGSLWGVEGQTLYALVRALKPERLVEIGGLSGSSATHIAAAIKANGKGHLYSIDNGVLGAIHGELIPSDLRQYVTLVEANGEDWLAAQEDESIGFVFEDAAHGRELVALLSRLSLQKLAPGGVLVNHDAGHDQYYDGNSFTNGVFNGAQGASDVGRNVRDGLADANAYFRVYRAEPSDCGLAVTVKPGIKILAGDPTGAGSIIGMMGNANIESVSEPPAPKEQPVKRTRKPRTSKSE